MNEFERKKLNDFQSDSAKKFDFDNFNLEDIYGSLNYMNAIERNIYRKFIDTHNEHTTKINKLNDSIKKRDDFINKCCLLMAACAIVNTILSAVRFFGA